MLQCNELVESIAKCLIANEIVKSTNMKDNLLLNKGLSVDFVPLPHCFVMLPHTLFKHFDLHPLFRAVRDKATPP
jgi:hypothetical protein